MKKRKLLFGLFVASAAVATLASCGAPTVSQPTTSETPSETTPSESKPSETTPSESKPSETTPSETTPSETTPSETTPSETTPSETTPSETTPSETNPQVAPKVYFHLDEDSDPIAVDTILDEGQYYVDQDKMDFTTENDFKQFIGWFLENGTEFSITNDVVESDTHIYAKWEAIKEQVKYDFNYEAFQTLAGGEKIKLTEDTTIGKFTVESGAYFEGNNTINNQQKAITFTVSGAGTLSFDMKGASGSGSTMSLYKVTGVDANGANVLTKIKEWDKVANGTVAGGNEFAFTAEDAGTYVLKSVGSFRISNLTVSDTVEKAPVTGITVTPKETKFLKGRDFSDKGLQVVLNYGNGRTESVTGAEVDSSEFNKDAAGVYTITVKYTLGNTFGSQKGQVFEASYKASVYEIDSLTLYSYVLDGSRNTLPLQRVFKLNDSFNSKNLAVHALAKCGDDTQDFVLNNNEYTIPAQTLDSLGAKTITVTAGGKEASYTAYVLDTVFASTLKEVEVTVDPNSEVKATNQGVSFKNINDALAYFELCELSDDCIKTIKLAPGTYNEKVFVTQKNVHLVGTGDSNQAATIVFDGLNGRIDPSGTISHSTDGAATFTVKGDGFYATNVCFKNKYNTHELYLQSQKEIGKDTQATAVLVRADKVVFENCYFTGYHDTLYADTGRQYYTNCYIEGRTDYIFGSTATAYFTGCTIKSLGAGQTENNGGYVLATKGEANKKFGFIFNGCSFDGDENVRDGSVSLARGWDKYMTIMIMNSTISAKFSKETYGQKTVYPEGAEYTKDLNDRYGKMNAEPVASQLFEYNNTGAGAITAEETDLIASMAEKSCTVLTEAAKAADYADLYKVFAGADIWNPVVQKNATVVAKKTDGTVLSTFDKVGYEGYTLSDAEIKVISESVVDPNGLTLVGLYTDEALTNEFTSSTVLTSETTIYAKFEALSFIEIEHKLNVATGFAATADTLINDIFYATNKVKTEGLKISGASYPADNLTFDAQYSLTSGKAAVDSNSIKFTIENDAKIVIYAAQKSDKNTNLVVLGADGKAVTLTGITKNGSAIDAFDVLNKTAVDKYEFELPAGTYYLGGAGGGAYIYGLTVTEVKAA